MSGIPDSVHYRPTSDYRIACASCGFYEQVGYCRMFDTDVEPLHVCDEWEPVDDARTAAASPAVPAAHHNRVIRAATKRADELTAKLEKIVQPILEHAGNEAARLFEAKATNHLTASFTQDFSLQASGDPVTNKSTMVALYPRTGEADSLAEDASHSPDRMHVTLAYLGQTEGPLAGVRDALLQTAGEHGPMSGQVGGVGVFGDNGNGHPAIVLPSIPGLAELRVATTQALSDRQIGYGRDWGFQPHMTVGYRDKPVTPKVANVGAPLHFDSLWVVRGDDERVEIPLTGSKPVTASVTGDVMIDQLVEVMMASLTGQEVAKVAEQHQPDGGYGETWWHEEDGAVYWNVGDWTTNDEIDAAIDDFYDVDGVQEVYIGDETNGPTGAGWERVYKPGMRAAGNPPPWTPPVADEIVDAAALVAALRGKTDPVRQAAIEAVMIAAVEGAGIDWDVTNPFFAKAMESTGSQITGIAETTQLNVMRIIRASYDQGLSIPSTATAIRQGMKAASFARATLIARTEMVGAVNVASLEATKLVAGITGTAYQKVWLTAPGAQYPRHEDYDDLDGQSQDLQDAFDVGGSDLQFPGDPGGPPEEVCNCRCTMVYEDASGDQTGDSVDADG